MFMSLNKSASIDWLIAALLICLSANAQSPPPTTTNPKSVPTLFPIRWYSRTANRFVARESGSGVAQEIIELFQANVYGRSPKAPGRSLRSSTSTKPRSAEKPFESK